MVDRTELALALYRGLIDHAVKNAGIPHPHDSRKFLARCAFDFADAFIAELVKRREGSE